MDGHIGQNDFLDFDGDEPKARDATIDESIKVDLVDLKLKSVGLVDEAEIGVSDVDELGRDCIDVRVVVSEEAFLAPADIEGAIF